MGGLYSTHGMGGLSASPPHRDGKWGRGLDSPGRDRSCMEIQRRRGSYFGEEKVDLSYYFLLLFLDLSCTEVN